MIYATVIELRDYSSLVAGLPDDELQRAITRAEEDVDRKITTSRTDLINGRRVDPVADLNVDERAALRQGTMEQALYRLHWGEEFFQMPSQAVSGGDASTERPVPKFSPVAKTILTQGGFIRLMGRLR